MKRPPRRPSPGPRSPDDEPRAGPEGPTAEWVAKWLLDELERRGVLRHDVAALEIVRIFGGHFCDRSADGVFSVGARVLEPFERLALLGPRRVLWDAATQAWRMSALPPSPYR